MIIHKVQSRFIVILRFICEHSSKNGAQREHRLAVLFDSVLSFINISKLHDEPNVKLTQDLTCTKDCELFDCCKHV